MKSSGERLQGGRFCLSIAWAVVGALVGPSASRAGEQAATSRASAPPLDCEAGVVLHVTGPQDLVVDPISLGASGRRLVLIVTESDLQRDGLRKRIAEARLGGLVTAVHQPALVDLPLASWYANGVIIEDPAGAMKRGLAWPEILRVASPRGLVVVAGMASAAAEAQLRQAGVRDRVEAIDTDGPWLRLRVALPADMGEWTHTRFADAGNREVSPDRMNPRRNAHVNSGGSHWEDDGPGSLEAAREPIWLRWLDGLYHPGNSVCSRGLVAADGVVVGTYSGESFARVRDGCLFDRGFVMSCRDAYNGALRWARPSGSSSLAIGGGRLFSLEGAVVRAIDLVDGRDLYSVSVTGQSIHDMRATRDVLAISVWKDEEWSVRGYATADGKPLWTRPIPWTQWAVADGRAIVAFTDKPIATTLPPASSKSTFLAQVSLDGLASFDLRTGAEQWRVSTADFPAAESRRLKCAGEGVAVLWAGDQLDIVDLQTGRLRFRVPADRSVRKGAKTQKEAIVSPLPGGRLAIADTTTRIVDLRSGQVQTVHDKALRLGLAEWACGYGRFAADMFLSLLTKARESAPAEVGSHGTSGTCGNCPAVAYHTVYMHTQGCGCAFAWGRTKGFVAAGRIDPMPSAEDFRRPGPLEKGPAFDRPPVAIVDAKIEWPLARANPERSAATGADIATSVRSRWSVRPDGLADGATRMARYVWRSNYLYSTTLTPPVVAAGKVVCAAPMTHEVLALDADTGRVAWRFQADGPVDSSPALLQGRCVFGCRDGAVYCLDLQDGALCWRRRVSPLTQRINVYGQLENRFPAVGAVMPDREGHVWATAGFNGQQRVIAARLSLARGDVADHRLLPRGSYPNDMLVTDADGALWLNYQPLSPSQECPLTSRMFLESFMRSHVLGNLHKSNPKLGPIPPATLTYVPNYLLSTDSELIGTARTTSPIGQMRFGKQGFWAPPSTQLSTTQGRICHVEMVYRGYPAVLWTWDAKQMVGLQALFTPPTGGDYPWGVKKELKSKWPVAKPGAVFAVSREKLASGAISESLLWQANLGEIWALAIAGDKVLAAGPVYPEAPPPAPTPDAQSIFGPLPDKPIQIDPLQAKGRLYLLSLADGKQLASIDLTSAPVQDGLAVVAGRVYVAGTDGALQCLDGR
jgi:outer membrane protein assembly factor BamB